jgi:hypothetical protein
MSRMEAWTDSLLDTDRAIRRPIRSWALELIRSIDRSVSQQQNKDVLDSAIAGASNIYALMRYLLGQHELAEQACQRQIQFANQQQHLPAAAIQPRINLIRLYRGIGNIQFAQQLIDELITKKHELTGAEALDGVQNSSEFLEKIYLHENFLLTLKISGPGKLPDLLKKIEVEFPKLGESAVFAERFVMAGMLCKDAAIVNEGLSKVAWKTSPHTNLVRAIYVSYWLAKQGDPRQASLLVQRMAGLGAASYQWRDHVILRILERLFTLAKFVKEDVHADQLNQIRGKVAKNVRDVHASVAAAYHCSARHESSQRIWVGVASRSGYRALPGIPSFQPRKRTMAEGRALLNVLDARLLAVYRSYETLNSVVSAKQQVAREA